MPDFAFQFWNRVDALLDSRKMSVKQLAQGIGVSYDVMRQWRSKNRFPKGNIPTLIAEWLGTTERFLLSGSDERSSFCEEARYVQQHIEARQLIRAIMEDPTILPLVSALAEKAVPSLKERNVEGL